MKKLLDMARGLIKADMVLKNATVLNLFINEWQKTDVAIAEGRILGLGDYQGESEIDLSGKYLVPGLIDAHMHIESTMVVPNELAKVLLKAGTTTIVADPHELVNVSGRKGMDYFLEASKTCPLAIYYALPSSVPCTDFETNGAGDFDDELMKSYVASEKVISLGEVMRYHDVINGDERMLKKLALFEDKVIDGHAPTLAGKNLAAYRLAGVKNDHECTTIEAVKDFLRTGFYVFVREGSGARNLEGIITGLLNEKLPFDRVVFCTDDKHLEDIEREGHISHNVRKAIALGVPAIQAIKMASLIPAELYRLSDKGAIGAGYDADIIVLDDVNTFAIDRVMVHGKWSDELDFSNRPKCSDDLLSSVHLPELTKEDISLEKKALNDIIEMIPHELLTKHIKEAVEGEAYFVPNQVYNKLVVVERHGKNGNVGVGILKGFNLKNAAIATSVAHDSHNVIACGDNDSDILLAIDTLKTIQGGYVIVSKGVVLDTLSLRIGGLMSEDSAESVQEKTKTMLNVARSLGVSDDIDPFITLSFMALPVIPEIRLTDKGLFSVIDNKFLK